MKQLLGLTAAAMLLQSTVMADTSAFTIVDDPALNDAIAQTRSEFLAMRTDIQPAFTRLDVALLIPQPDGTYKRGTYNPTALAYPASTVKLGYLAAAMYWCRTNGHPYDYLDADVRPMIKDSDNYACGRTVDDITGAPNISNMKKSTDPDFLPWYNKRLYTENYLSARGLLENQTMMHKTYPTNSGSGPIGAEDVAINYRGGNRMQPKCVASLMLEIQKGAIEPGANAYMRELLTHERWEGNSVFGFGLPPGTTYENKWGAAYDTSEDVARVVLPNGKEFILAAYSNGYDATQPFPYDNSILGVFCEMLVERLGLDAGDPAKIKIDDGGSGYSSTGAWSSGSTASEKHGTSYAFATGTNPGSSSATFALNVPESGHYEICVWYSQGTNRATDAPYTINYAGGSSTMRVNQQSAGGRWIRLGDFDFNAGQGSIVLTNDIANSSQVVIADAVKATEWPAGSAPVDCYVDAISLSTGQSGKNYHANADVTINDVNGAALPGAAVLGTWSGSVNESQSATTDSNGVASFQSPGKKNGGTFTFTVTGVTKAGYSYNSSLNVISSATISAP
jgi:hypothetical protein